MNIREALDLFEINTLCEIDERIKANPTTGKQIQEDIINKCIQSYKKKAKAIHPDIKGDESTKEMQKLNEAIALVKKMQITMKREYSLKDIKSEMINAKLRKCFVFQFRYTMKNTTDSNYTSPFTNGFSTTY